MSAADQNTNTHWGLKKQEFAAVRCTAVVGDSLEQPDVVALQERKMAAAQSGSYLEAQKAKMELKAHYETENRNKTKALEAKYKEDFETFDMHQLGTFANYNADKERHLQEYDAKAAEAITGFSDRQKEAHTKYMEKLQAETLPLKPRWSPELLRLRKVEGLLCKQTEYTQANFRKSKASDLEKMEQGQWEAVRNRKIKTLEEQFVQKQKEAMDNAKKKIASARDELETKNKRELERMHQFKKGHELKITSNRKAALNKSQSEIGRVSFARQLCGTATAAGLRP